MSMGAEVKNEPGRPPMHDEQQDTLERLVPGAGREERQVLALEAIAQALQDQNMILRVRL